MDEGALVDIGSDGALRLPPGDAVVACPCHGYLFLVTMEGLVVCANCRSLMANLAVHDATPEERAARLKLVKDQQQTGG